MTQTFAQHLAGRVAAELKTQGRSQQQLAAHLGLAQSSVSKWFRGINSISLNDLARIADYLGIPVAELVDGRSEGNSGQHSVSPAPTPPGRAGKQSTDGPTRSRRHKSNDDAA